jgi:hypothetical protein
VVVGIDTDPFSETSILKEQVATPDQHHAKIVDAIDLLMRGF